RARLLQGREWMSRAACRGGRGRRATRSRGRSKPKRTVRTIRKPMAGRGQKGKVPSYGRQQRNATALADKDPARKSRPAVARRPRRGGALPSPHPPPPVFFRPPCPTPWPPPPPSRLPFL